MEFNVKVVVLDKKLTQAEIDSRIASYQQAFVRAASKYYIEKRANASKDISKLEQNREGEAV